MSLTFRNGDDAFKRGLDITISLTPSQAKALGPEVSTLADWFDTALWALAWLRSGQSIDGQPHAFTLDDFHTAINDLDHRLLPRLEGVRDAMIRAHAEAGGSVGDLALAMDVSRSTAQYRRETLLNKTPAVFESWATGSNTDQS
ncbi:hypothetical protein [Kitasatospora sp. NPDC058478]|uniref:hypothetical protein n=1 Tax=unclassified Kitasatospora TaxID=2633591 RepID=UPI0036572883